MSLEDILWKIGLVPRKQYQADLDTVLDQRDSEQTEKIEAEEEVEKYKSFIIGMLQQHLIFQNQSGGRHIIVPSKDLSKAHEFKLSIKEEYGSDKYYFVSIEKKMEE